MLQPSIGKEHRWLMNLSLVENGGMTDMKYVDGFVLAMPEKNLTAYRQMAEIAGRIWKKYGALEFFECVGDDLENPEYAGIRFPQMIGAGPGEKVVFSFIVFKSREHRDDVNAKVMKDPFMNDPEYRDKPMPFDMKRMAYGGFHVIVEV
jgi:uncharacterized protein YbaA (DUF1428 family)